MDIIQFDRERTLDAWWVRRYLGMGFKEWQSWFQVAFRDSTAMVEDRAKARRLLKPHYRWTVRQ